MRTMHVQIRLAIVPQGVHPDYPHCALACMLLYFCNNYGPVVYLVVFLHYVPCALST